MENNHVVNLTKFKATADLEKFGVTDLSNWKLFQEIRNLLYFSTPPTQDQITQRVERLGQIAVAEAHKIGASTVLVACPPWMMRALCAELVYHNLSPVLTFTKKDNELGPQVLSLVKAA